MTGERKELQKIVTENNINLQKQKMKGENFGKEKNIETVMHT